MFIDRVARQLLAASELEPLRAALAAGEDATLAVAQSARPLVTAALWAADPRPTLLVVSGEEAADRTTRALAAWLGLANVMRYPERRDWPWADKPADDAVVGARVSAMAALAVGEPRLVVASARSLLRRVPPVSARAPYYGAVTFSVGQELPFAEVGASLVALGYADAGEADAPGAFHVHGDTVDVWPAQATSPVRVEFFGDEVDRIRKVVPATGQTIGELREASVVACREIALTESTVANARRNLYKAASESSAVAADLELIVARSAAPALDRYLGALYGGSASPVEHVSAEALVVLAEPRSLFDDCVRAYDEISAIGGAAHISPDELATLYTAPRDLDFGKQQRLSFAAMIRAGGGAPTAELVVRQPGIAGADSKLLGRVRQLVRENAAVVFAVPDRGARESLELRFADEHVPFVESLATAPENMAMGRGSVRRGDGTRASHAA